MPTKDSLEDAVRKICTKHRAELQNLKTLPTGKQLAKVHKDGIEKAIGFGSLAELEKKLKL